MRKRKIFARYSIPKKEQLIARLEYWANEKNTHLNNEIDLYIKGRLSDIRSSSEIIIRENQRIKKADQCIDMAISLLNQQENKKITELIQYNYKLLRRQILSNEKIF
jgi:hypothetical protein